MLVGTTRCSVVATVAWPSMALVSTGAALTRSQQPTSSGPGVYLPPRRRLSVEPPHPVLWAVKG